ncbi:MAG: ATP-binding region ATPase domain protein [Gemmatimonadetes bacterium]|jgi:signal transduction histidine kinase|nr:ATP-binding region ATPase domain protein [Gemmatimonadota bacterium]
MTLRARLALGLVIIATVLVVPLLVARASLHRLHDQVRSLREGEFQASLVLGRLRDALGDVRARELALGVTPTDTVHAQLVAALRAATALADSLDHFRLDSAGHRIRADLATMTPAVEREYAAMRSDSSALADRISQSIIAPALQDADRQLSPAELLLRSRTRDRVLDAESAVMEAQRSTLTALTLALLLAGLIAFLLTRSISRPVVALEAGMRAVADGELGHTLDIRTGRNDEFGRLAASFQDMSRQLAELDKLKAEFVSIASHELKTPINVILGYLTLMEEGVYGPLTEKQKPVTKTIEAQARTIARLASQLLDVSRFEAGGGRIDARPVNLSTMLDELEHTFHVLAVQREIDFRVTRRPGLPGEVVWDAERINEVTGNLLSNAFKFTPPGGTIELIAAPAGDRVSITVRDTGAGIPPDQLPHVFEKFYQADNQRSASAKGTGLGLAIAREIVTAHKGDITCESEPGKGTTFSILLPVSVENRRKTGASHHASTSGQSA